MRYWIILLIAICIFTCGMPASGIVQTMSASLTSASIGSWSGSYGYKLDGNIENRTEAGLSEDFGYDFDGNGTDESNMLSEIAGNPVSWDKNGWLTSEGMHNFVYDYDGKMQVATSLIDSDITVTYQYDPMGNRVGRVETNSAGQIVSEKKYILDYSSKVPNILLEMQKVSGNWQISQKNYYYGNMLVMSTDGSNQNRRYYIHDRLGSVRVVTNRNIAVLNNHTYTPYGEDIAGQTTETVVNNVRYAGYNFDRELGQYYVWARMYSPYMARFNGYDPVLGDFKEPLTLHQYLYCLNDPVNMYDPDGRFSMAGNVTTTAQVALMAASAGMMAQSMGDGLRGSLISSIMKHQINLIVTVAAVQTDIVFGSNIKDQKAKKKSIHDLYKNLSGEPLDMDKMLEPKPPKWGESGFWAYLFYRMVELASENMDFINGINSKK